MTLALEEPLGFFEASYFLRCREIAEAMEFSSSGSLLLDNGKLGMDSKSCSRNGEEADSSYLEVSSNSSHRKEGKYKEERTSKELSFDLVWPHFELVGIRWIKVVLFSLFPVSQD